MDAWTGLVWLMERGLKSLKSDYDEIQIQAAPHAAHPDLMQKRNFSGC